MGFPEIRPRRLRRNETIRRMVRETKLSVDDLIYPMFVCPGKGVRREVPSMPGVFNLSVDQLVKEAKEAAGLGIPAVLLFGIPAKKDPLGKDAYSDRGIVQTAVRALKDAVPDLMAITDVCFCEYTDHGHCGVLEGGDVDNDATLELLARSAVSHARAGADIVAPSDMMDGRVGAIRRALDAEGFRK
ncbi:MAG: delta-aminolevulinic acid dehydratase, partial [Deltaproteobacteria bacterium]|nr:delta-aminolevulinic acid dehydratase [Deltaproteobacteria bacterium]